MNCSISEALNLLKTTKTSCLALIGDSGEINGIATKQYIVERLIERRVVGEDPISLCKGSDLAVLDISPDIDLCVMESLLKTRKSIYLKQIESDEVDVYEFTSEKIYDLLAAQF